MSVLGFANKYLFQPVGIREVIWYQDATGLHLGCGSSLWRPRDLLKFGNLCLNNGLWDGTEIVPPWYVKESTRIHTSGDMYGLFVNYGYLWYINDFSGLKAFNAEGYGSQLLYVIPDLNLVVLCTSDWERPRYLEHFELVEKFVIPAIID